MRRAFACVFVGLLIAAAAVSGRRSADTDIAIVNARVFTGVPAAPWAEALRIEGDRITLVGTSAAVRARTASSTRVIDAGGRLVIPGINDAHAHADAVPTHTALDAPPAMTEDPSWAVTLERVKAAVAKTPAGGWIIGEIGGAVLDDPIATRIALDPITGDRPLMLASWHGHGTIFNTAALRKLGVSETEPDPPGGLFARAADGKTLTGLAHEYADYGLRQRVSMLPPEAEQIAAFQRYAREAASFGITSVQAMMTGYPAAKAAPLITKAGLPVRMRLIDFPMDSPAQWWGAVRGPQSPKLTISGVKYVLDGTPIERFMLLREPYADSPTRGRLNFTEKELRSFLAVAASARVQPMFHAVGDAAVDTVLAALDAVQITPPHPGSIWKERRPRIEHGDMFEAAHVESATRHGVVVVQNPAHFMLGPMMKARLGDRVKRTTMVKTIVRSGVPFALGSDGPMNPFLNVMFATINEVNPAEALTVEEALVAYTRGSAYAEFAERTKGSIAPGMLADVAILSQDIFTVPPPELPKTTSLLTIVGGTIVHGKM